MDNRSHTVGELARIAGISVRTLHHYDEIGLISPRRRTDSGYRLYGRSEIERLQEVLFYRELGIALKEIKQIIDEPGYTRQDALERQRQQLVQKTGILLSMIDSIDRTLEAARTGNTMNAQDMLEVFGDFDPSEYAAEAADRWGDTADYAQSAKRVNSYTTSDWTKINREAAEINEGLVGLMVQGIAANTAAAMNLAEQHRSHISRWFYECSADTHAGLGEMYVADPRFRRNIDRAGEGLARFLSDAIRFNHLRLSNG